MLRIPHFPFSLALLCLILTIAGNAGANPQNGAVVAGSARISHPAPRNVTVTQKSQRAVINWQSFSIGNREAVRFNQPGPSSVTLNRVVGSNLSNIAGSLSANGIVFLVNPNGVLFTHSARVDVNGLLATTNDIANDDFMAGRCRFTIPGKPKASVVNKGAITAAQGGLVALVAPSVRNDGVIAARLGRISLTSGDAFTIDLYGDQLIQFAVPAPSANGTLIENMGTISAAGGTIMLTADTAARIVDDAINNKGLIEAVTVRQESGEIVLDGGNHGRVQVSGTLNASGKDAGQNGGTIKVLGGKKDGTVNISGTLAADAGAGGRGGVIETSASRVKVADSARVTTNAPLGQNGTWLIDPHDFTIAASGADMSGAALSAGLGSNNMSILSSAGAGGSQGDININDAVSWNSNKLTLIAAHNININAVMTAADNASLALNPATGNGGDSTDGGTGTVVTKMGSSGHFRGRVDFSGTGTLSINGDIYTVINSLGVAGDSRTTTLQGMQNNLSGYYVLGNNIDASPTTGWNGGAGFQPIGSQPIGSPELGPFGGKIDGLGHTINNLVINNTTQYGNAGLFGGTNGIIENVGLQGGSVTGTGQSNSIGSLTGWNDGTITNAYATGTVTGKVTDHGSWASIGGLVGENNGTITNSYATGTVTGTVNFISHSNGAYVGGLAGQNGGTITNDYATGTISETANSGLNGAPGGAGGLVGESGTGTITNSYATGTVTGTDRCVGGLVGFGLNYNGTPTNIYWDTITSGTTIGVGSNTGADTNTDAIGLTTRQLKASLPSGFDPSIWKLDVHVNNGYPSLRWQTASIPTPAPAPAPTPSPSPTPKPTSKPSPKLQPPASQLSTARALHQSLSLNSGNQFATSPGTSVPTSKITPATRNSSIPKAAIKTYTKELLSTLFAKLSSLGYKSTDNYAVRQAIKKTVKIFYTNVVLKLIHNPKTLKSINKKLAKDLTKKLSRADVTDLGQDFIVSIFTDAASNIVQQALDQRYGAGSNQGVLGKYWTELILNSAGAYKSEPYGVIYAAATTSIEAIADEGKIAASAVKGAKDDTGKAILYTEQALKTLSQELIQETKSNNPNKKRIAWLTTHIKQLNDLLQEFAAREKHLNSWKFYVFGY